MNEKAIPMIQEKYAELERLMAERSEMQRKHEKESKEIDIAILNTRSSLGMLVRMLSN